MRLLVFMLVAMIMATSAVRAESDEGAVAGRLLAVTYMCREKTGIAHYQAARSTVYERLKKHLGGEAAYKLVSQAEEKFVSDPKMISRDINSGKCFELINDIYFQLKAFD